MGSEGLKSHLTDWEKPGIEPATPFLKDIGLSPTPLRASLKLFVAFPWVVTSTGLGGFIICVFILGRELPKAQPKMILWRSRESNR